jgi:hypothetical protein
MYEKVITIEDPEGNLIGIVRYNEKNRSPEIYGVNLQGMDGVLELLKSIKNK